jgi:hypothetical protein
MAASTTACTICIAEVFILHQRRASPFVAHFFGRAAHVDIDDLRAALNVVDRGICHHVRVCACDLHRDGAASPSWLARREVFKLSHKSLREVTISLTAYAAPSCLHNMRNGLSVTPAMGATNTLCANSKRTDAHVDRIAVLKKEARF